MRVVSAVPLVTWPSPRATRPAAGVASSPGSFPKSPPPAITERFGRDHGGHTIAECIAAASHHADLAERCLRTARARWEDAEVRAEAGDARVEAARRRIRAVNEHLELSQWVMARLRDEDFHQ